MRIFSIMAIGIACLFSACSSKNQTTIERTESKRPNILFAISDDQSFPHAGAYGYSAARTPNFDRVAREGILFYHGFSAAPGCSPSRASILTGRHIWQIEDAGTHASGFPTQYVTYTDLLAEHGYHVGFTGKGWGPGNYEVSGRTYNPAGKEFNELKVADAPPHIRNTDYAANFKSFLEQRAEGQPFCFWYGGSEPHRAYDEGIGLRNGIDTAAIEVPPFLPAVADVKSDIADYLYEIEYFDMHLGRMIAELEDIGELDNTVIIVTSDNGMPFPRAKANLYEYGIHMPLAARWGDRAKPGRSVLDMVSLTDIAPTILELAEVEHPGEYAMSGKSLMHILLSEREGLVDENRHAVYAGRERHSSSRWNNLTYPSRAMRTQDYLYIRNFKPERWPAGAPLRYNDNEQLVPGYHDIDEFSKSYIFENREDPVIEQYFEWATAKRPEEELYRVSEDPGCLKNIADDPAYSEILATMRNDLQQRLTDTQDPRVTGDGDIWESYVRYSPIRKFPKPDWAEGEQ
jgi:uncharacterized sulfatase